MNKEFAPRELALRLKKLGFNETCFGIFYPSVDEVKTIPTDFFNEKAIVEKGFIKAPTFSQAFRWLRDKNDLAGYSFPNALGSYGFTIVTLSENHHSVSSEMFNTNEEAELACLEKLLEIVEQKPK